MNTFYRNLALGSISLILMLGSTTAYASAPNAEEEKGFFSWIKDKVVGIIHPRVSFPHGEPPRDFFLNPLPSFFKLADKTEVTILSTDLKISSLTLSRGSVVELDAGQDVYLNSSLDQALLDYSMRIGGREAAMASAYDLNGKELSRTNMHAGDRSSVNAGTMLGVFTVAARAPNAQLIDLVHTHPGYEFSYKSKNDSGIRGSLLSSSDISWTVSFSLDNPHLYVRIRAVLPNGYSYSMTLLNGQRVLDPIYSKTPMGVETKTLLFKRLHPEVEVTDNLKRQVGQARELNELVELTNFETELQREERILKMANISEADNSYKNFRISVRSLLLQGETEENIIEMVKEADFKIKTIWILDELSFMTQLKDTYRFDKITVESLLHQGIYSAEEVLELMKASHVKMAMLQKQDENDLLKSAPSCTAVLKNK